MWAGWPGYWESGVPVGWQSWPMSSIHQLGSGGSQTPRSTCSSLANRPSRRGPDGYAQSPPRPSDVFLRDIEEVLLFDEWSAIIDVECGKVRPVKIRMPRDR
jgi:hypothetical protein